MSFVSTSVAVVKRPSTVGRDPLGDPLVYSGQDDR